MGFVGDILGSAGKAIGSVVGGIGKVVSSVIGWIVPEPVVPSGYSGTQSANIGDLSWRSGLFPS